MEYWVIKWVVHAALPILSKVIISALNTVMQVADGESWVQILLKVVEEVNQSTGPFNMDSVVRNVLRSQPPRAQDVPDMASYVLTCRCGAGSHQGPSSAN